MPNRLTDEDAIGCLLFLAVIMLCSIIVLLWVMIYVILVR